MRDKVKCIITAAEKEGFDVAVFSAFGCGAFRNPPGAVANMFFQELRESTSKMVVFSIFYDHNAGMEHYPKGNFAPFNEIFEEANWNAGI
jgi:hypothetical protein